MYKARQYKPSPPSQVLGWSDAAWGGLREGQATSEPKAVFGRIECDFVTEAAPETAPATAKKGGKGGKQQQGKEGGGKSKGGAKQLAQATTSPPV